MTLTFRPATHADIPAVADLAARTFPLACPPALPRASVDGFIAQNLSAEAFSSYLGAPGHAVLVGLDEPSTVRAYALLVDGTAMDEACASMIQTRPCVGISKFYLDPELHGAGAASALLDECSAYARSVGAAALWLATNIGNARARAFYAKNGFVERGHRVFTVGGVDNDDMVLELPL